ncbi:MAG: protein kinase [Clostridia bacterium]|nr:protein kinase [Clostridia bacterium]MBR1606095.1 protein kinase [Clostridia bacterium]
MTAEEKTVLDGGQTVYEAPQATLPEDAFSRGATLLSTYRIETDAIKGGMGAVWRVHHVGWNTDLAMKRPQPQMFADETAKQNFIHECQCWIDLGLHPNIVSCYYVREIGGVPTIFSEWMENGSLENHIQKGTLYTGSEQEQQARLLDIAIQYARGLHYAHESGLIHQDVKPDNLLLTKDWQAKAADFGLAKARGVLTVKEQAGDGATQMAASGGYTPAYCSMEQMDGKALTRRTDIYSWAVSVMEMYLGARPWQNGVVAGMSCRDYFEDCRVPMPESLQALLAKCMETDPEARPHDFAIIQARLKDIYQDTLGERYARPEPQSAADTADSLNNRALTYLDLGMPEKAEACWAEALEKEPDAAIVMYNQTLYRVRGDPKRARDGYTLAEGFDNLFSNLIQRYGGMPTPRIGRLLANLNIAHYAGVNADMYLEQCVSQAEEGSAEREELLREQKRVSAAWMRLPPEPEKCGFIAFDVADDVCAVAWQQDSPGGGFDTCLAIYDLPNRHELNRITLSAKNLEGKTFRRVFLCGEAVYLCGADGISFAAFDPRTLERLPAYERCDFTRRSDIREWPYVAFSDGLRAIQKTYDVVRVSGNRGATVPRDDLSALWRPMPNVSRKGGGMNFRVRGEPQRNGLKADAPALGLSSDQYAISADSGHRWLLVFTKPVFVSQKRYFAIYNLDVFGHYPEYVIARALSYAEAFGRQSKLETLLEQAEACRQAEKWQEALELLEKAYQLNPEHPSEEWSRINNAVGRSPACRRQALRGSRNTGTLKTREVPTFRQDPNAYNLSAVIPGGVFTVMMTLANSSLPHGFAVVDRCNRHLTFQPGIDRWVGKDENGRALSHVPKNCLQNSAIGILDQGNRHCYVCNSGVLSAWDDTAKDANAFLGAVRFGQDLSPTARSDAAFLNGLPPLDPADTAPRWALEPYLVSLNRPMNATVALVQSRVLNRYGPEKDGGVCAMSVIDLRTMELLHTEFLHASRKIDIENGGRIGMQALMDISPEGDVFLWRSFSHSSFLWLIPAPGQFSEVEIGSVAVDILRKDSTAFIGMFSTGPNGDEYNQVTLDWQYALRDGSETRFLTGQGLAQEELTPVQAPRPVDPTADLLAGLEQQARSRLQEKAPAPRPADPMADLLAEMERRARERLDKKPK